MIDGDKEPELIVGPREQLFHLLAEAAEIEHTLMCSYLYAAWSLKQAHCAALSASEKSLVSTWRRTILGVATDEMVHLLLVCNLSIALGGRPHLGRPNFPIALGYFPCGLVVKLSGFSRDTLKHFSFLERPQGLSIADSAPFAPSRIYHREQAFVGLMPSSQDYATVGHLYDAVRENLIASAERLGERALFVGPASAQLGPEVIKLPGVVAITDLRSALTALDAIVEQGEGSSKSHEESHHQRFRRMELEYETALTANPEFAPAWPVATSPVMRRPPESKDKVFVDDPVAARVLDFGNATYCLLLRCLSQSFGRTGNDAGEWRTRYLDAAIGLMHVLSISGTILAERPASHLEPGINAGLSFTMLRSVEPLFAGMAEWGIVCERMTELAAGARMLQGIDPSFTHISDKLLAIATVTLLNTEIRHI